MEEKRQFYRFVTCFPAKLFNAFVPGEGYEGMVTNIGVGGARIFIKDSCPDINYVLLNLHLLNNKQLELINGRVIYQQKNQDGTYLGVIFMNMDTNKLSVLVDFLGLLEAKERTKK